MQPHHDSGERCSFEHADGRACAKCSSCGQWVRRLSDSCPAYLHKPDVEHRIETRHLVVRLSVRDIEHAHVNLLSMKVEEMYDKLRRAGLGDTLEIELRTDVLVPVDEAKKET